MPNFYCRTVLSFRVHPPAGGGTEGPESSIVIPYSDTGSRVFTADTSATVYPERSRMGSE